MTTVFRRLILSLQFLTIITVWPGIRAKGRDLAGTTAFFPFIGLLIGAGLMGSRYVLGNIFPPILADAVIVLLMVVFTRGLHLEGVADTADGLIGGLTRDKALLIMKDSNSGAFAIMAVAGVLMLKWAAIMSLPPVNKLTVLLLAPVAGRWAMTMVIYLSDYARAEGGLGKSFVNEVTISDVLLAAVIAFGAGILIMGSQGAAIMAGVAVFAFVLKIYFKHRIGGVTGDNIGAANELTEVGVFMALAWLGV